MSSIILPKILYTSATQKILKKRVFSHNKAENKSTKAYIPLKLIHYEAYSNIKDAGMEIEHGLSPYCRN